jgi:ribonuclease-3
VSRLGENIDQLQEAIGYSFQDLGILELALRHRSMGSINNERLEFLGDTVLGMVVTDILFREDEDAGEALLTRRRSQLTDRTTLRMVGERLDLLSYLYINPGLRGKVSVKMLADAVEALIGAVYLDGGMEPAALVVKRLLMDREVMEQVLGREDWITRLKEWCDINRRALPKYVTLEEDGEDLRTFTAWLTIDHHTENGSGLTKKEAMAEAARKMVNYIERQSLPEEPG